MENSNTFVGISLSMVGVSKLNTPSDRTHRVLSATQVVRRMFSQKSRIRRELHLHTERGKMHLNIKKNEI